MRRRAVVLLRIAAAVAAAAAIRYVAAVTPDPVRWYVVGAVSVAVLLVAALTYGGDRLAAKGWTLEMIEAQQDEARQLQVSADRQIAAAIAEQDRLEQLLVASGHTLRDEDGRVRQALIIQAHTADGWGPT